MFTSNARFNALKSAFLKTMDNKTGNDWAAHQSISHLASTMTDFEVHQAYSAAREHAEKKNSKKNGLFDRKDPYKNIDSASAQVGAQRGFAANDWMQRFPLVPPQLWGLFSNFRGF